MNDTAVAPESKSPPIWQRRWLQITAAIVLLVALMLAALPFALGHSLESWLKDQGASTATVENIDLNLFTGQLRIDQLNYQFSDGAPQHLEQLTTTLNVRDLWQRLIHIESLTINNSSIALSVDSEGRLTVASLALPATKSDASTQQQNPWGFTLDQLILDSASISYSSSQLNGQLTLEQLKLEHLSNRNLDRAANLTLTATLNDTPLQLAAELRPFNETQRFETQLQLEQFDLQSIAPLLNKQLTALSGALSAQTTLIVEIDAKELRASQLGEINLGGLSLANDTLSTTLAKGRFGGRIDFNLDLNTKQPSVDLIGTLTTEQLATTIGTETKSGIDQLTIDSTTSLSHSEVGAMKLDFDGTIDARGARYRRADIAYRNQQLTYKGNAQITLPVEHSPSVVINGDISHKQLALALAENHLNVSQQQGAWSGNIYVKENKPSATGSLSSGTTQIDDSNKQLTLARYHHLNAKEIELRAIDDLTIGSLRSEQLTLLKPHTTNSDEKSEQLFNSGSLTLDNLHYQADQITAINSITLDNMALLLRRTAKGEIALINQLQSGKSDKSDPGSKQQIPIKIQQIKVTGKSHLDFVDEAITPNYKNRITLKQLAVNQIDSSTPSTGSPFELKANIGSYTHLAFGGELYPFAEHPTLKLKGDIDTLDLPPLSPYTIQSLGYELTSGHASAEIELEIDAGKLKGENRVKLNNLEVDAADPEKMEHLSNQLSMPLDSALSLLRDDENNIKLKLPLGGDLAHPEFSLANTINQALGKAMKTTAMTYLKYYFQPYGTLIAIAELAEAAASAVRLDPITYPATISSLNPEQIKYLEKVGKLMQEHKQIRVRLCGKANESEIKALLAAKQKAAAKESGEPSAAKTAEEKQPVVAPQMTPELEQQLTEVARARAETIQKHLMEHYQIEAERLFVCNPKIETDSDEKPRVELLI